MTIWFTHLLHLGYPSIFNPHLTQRCLRTFLLEFFCIINLTLFLNWHVPSLIEFECADLISNSARPPSSHCCISIQKVIFPEFWRIEEPAAWEEKRLWHSTNEWQSARTLLICQDLWKISQSTADRVNGQFWEKMRNLTILNSRIIHWTFFLSDFLFIWDWQTIIKSYEDSLGVVITISSSSLPSHLMNIQVIMELKLVKKGWL